MLYVRINVNEFTRDHGRRYHQEIYTSGSGPVTHQRNVLGVSSEKNDVLLHPMKHGYLVHETVVGHTGSRVGRSVGVQKSWNTKNKPRSILRNVGENDTAYRV